MRKKVATLFLLFVFVFASLATAAETQWTFPDKWLKAPTASEKGIDQFQQAPSLQEKVENNELPPVGERLPDDPFVREPYKSAGKYGGTLTVAATGPNAYNDITHARVPNLFTNDPGASKVIPELAKSYEFKDNSTKLIIKLREGVKWSDGHPFTADDIMYWYEDEILNPDISIWARSFWEVDGQFPEVKKLDKYTIEMEFAAPFRPTKAFLNYWTSQQTNFFEPAHYLKKYHKKYNSDVEKLAEKEGYDNWKEMYYDHRDIYPGQKFPDTPVLGPWVLKKRSSTQRVYKRNPYYFAVDSEGNQLPYIDELKVKIVSDREVAILDAMQGELDIAGFILKPSGFPMYKRKEDKGDYKVHAWRSANSSEVTYGFNLNHPDKVKREIFKDVRFRRALSLAINRKELNQFVYQGLGEPSQVTVAPSCSYYKEEWAKSYAEYDPERAKKLLNEMGLEKNSDGFYMRPDGKVLTINMDVPSGSSTGTVGMDEVNELVTQYWNSIGVKTEFKMISRDLFYQRTESTEHDIASWHADRMQELRAYLPGLAPIEMGGSLQYASEWSQWRNYQTWLNNDKKGDKPSSKGIEPPAEVKDYMELKASWYKAQTEKEYKRIAQEIFDFHADKVWLIGTVARSLRPVIVQNDLKNVPERLPFSDGTSFWRIARPDQFYFDN